jgi:hypothetical protein
MPENKGLFVGLGFVLTPISRCDAVPASPNDFKQLPTASNGSAQHGRNMAFLVLFATRKTRLHATAAGGELFQRSCSRLPRIAKQVLALRLQRASRSRHRIM